MRAGVAPGLRRCVNPHASRHHLLNADLGYSKRKHTLSPPLPSFLLPLQPLVISTFVITGRMPRNFRGQDYSSIKKDCLKKGQLFEDLEFPANNKSLFFSKVDPTIEWMRPKVREGELEREEETDKQTGRDK